MMTASSSISGESGSGANPQLNQESLRELARSAGFVEAGIVNLPHADVGRDADRFRTFVENGYAGSMKYLARTDAEGRLIRSDVLVPFPWARSIVVCLSSYNSDAPLSIAEADVAEGWIARYAWTGRRAEDGTVKAADYHKILLRQLNRMEAEMHARWGEFTCRLYVDTGPVQERAAARAAGVGWTGKNTCLIHPKLGSWNFLAVMVTSLEVAPESSPLTIPDRCGSCRRCLEACPTGALIGAYQMDASKCISYLTIEHQGEVAEELREGVGRQIFGCDICQDVCPWNRKAPLRGATAAKTDLVTQEQQVSRDELINPSLEWLADLDLEGFERLFNGSPVRRTGYEGFRRNLAIAMGNSGLSRFAKKLEEWAALKPFNEAPAAIDDPDKTPGHESILSSHRQTDGMQGEATAKDIANRRGLRDAAQWAINRLRQLSASDEKS